MFRNKSVSVHQFTMVPRADVPRSAFRMQTMHKTTFDAGKLVPVFVEEVLPGDSYNCKMTAFCRLSTPIAPIMDNLHLESFFFFVPYRLLWDNFKRFMGEQDNPGDSISYVIPQHVCPAGGYAINSLQDYMGLPTVGQVAGGATVSHSALPVRAYNLIWNEWFRDENLQNSLTVDKGNGPDTVANYTIQYRGKRKDYITSALPWPLKGGVEVPLPLGSTAAVKTSSTRLVTGAQSTMTLFNTSTGNAAVASRYLGSGAGSSLTNGTSATGGAFTDVETVYPGNLYADLSAATASTINQLRQAFQIQRLLERDARGGTRYIEKVFSHFGVRSPDARLQRPEYLGGGSVPISINPVAQTSGTSASGTTTPLGNLAAFGTALAGSHGFTGSFTEHGVILGLVNVRADLTYQQGVRRFWFRSTQYDFYWPVFQALGEQAIYNREVYCRGDANDALVFGYQERWAEYRYFPSMVTGLFRSTAAGTVDVWHLAQKFTSLPTLSTTFIKDSSDVQLQRVLAVGAGAGGQQFLCDAFFDMVAVRPLPMFSVPGMIDHF